MAASNVPPVSNIWPWMASPRPEIDDGSTETQEFVCVTCVSGTFGSAEPGQTIRLTRQEFDHLKSIGGVIEGEWAPAQENQPAPELEDQPVPDAEDLSAQ